MLLHLMPQVRKVERACKRHMLVLREVEAHARPGCLASVMLRCPAGHDVHDWRVVLVINGVIVREPLRAAPFDSVAQKLVGRSLEGFTAAHGKHTEASLAALHRARMEAARNQRARTHCKNGHAYTEGNVLIHVSRDGRTVRRCRECNRRRCMRYYESGALAPRHRSDEHTA